MQLATPFLSFCLFTALQLSATGMLHAETETQYAVDIVVFEDSEARYLASEQWLGADDPAMQLLANDQQTTSRTGKLDAVQKPTIRSIDPSGYELLDGAVKRLVSSKRYHVLVRKSWLQPGLDRANAVDIDLNSGTTSGSAGMITGSVKIVLERYLHLYTDMVYHRPSSEISSGISITPAGNTVPAVNPTEDFIIREHRRMRSKELHYIDHPLIGILIKIIPVETTTKASR